MEGNSGGMAITSHHSGGACHGGGRGEGTRLAMKSCNHHDTWLALRSTDRRGVDEGMKR